MSKYITVKNLEKYHSGYKDRELRWAKIYFKMVQGDPEFEMIDNEIDKWRFVCFVILELQAQKPIPYNEDYLKKKGFNLKKRPISLTLNMLHKFVEVVNGENILCGLDKEEDKEEDKDSTCVTINFSFDEFWNLYDKKVGLRSKLEKKWINLTNEDREKAMEYIPRYKESQPDKQYRKHPETFLNNKSWNDEIITTQNNTDGIPISFDDHKSLLEYCKKYTPEKRKQFMGRYHQTRNKTWELKVKT